MPTMNRRSFIRCSSAAMAASSLAWRRGATAQAWEPGRRPNVVLIVSDDQGYGDLGCYGNPVLKTPHLDRLHGESGRLTRFYTAPVCSPMRASLMTGRYHYRTGVVDTYAGRSMMDPSETTLAQLLGAAGYRTGIFGKWHLGDNYPLQPIDRGFQEALVHHGGGIAQPSDPEYYDRDDTYFDPVLQHNGTAVKTQGYCTDVITDGALRFIQQAGDTPFFAYVAYNAPHTPLQAPEADAAPYLEAGISEKNARLYGMITNMDRNVGRILESLDRSGKASDTIVIFMPDNGAQDLGEPGRFNGGLRAWKGTAYEGGIRVPCFMRWPSRWQAGRDIDRIASVIDMAPTLLDACGVGTGSGPRFDGWSLVPLLAGASEPGGWPERELFVQWHRGDAPEPFKNSAVIAQRWKLVNGEELYDVAADPAESHNAATWNPGVAQQLREKYEAWFADVSATRGYAPVRVHLGNDRENPLTLSRQDWRGQDNWTSDEKPGHWEVYVEVSGAYEAGARFAPLPQDGTLRISFGGAAGEVNVQAGATEARVTGLRPATGDTRLECAVAFPGGIRAPRFITVSRS